MVGRQSQCQFFADVVSGVVDDGQAVGIGVLSETGIGRMLRDSFAQIAQVLFDGFGNMFEFSVRRSAKDNDFAAELFEQRRAACSAASVVAVQYDFEFAFANGVDINQVKDFVDVRLCGIVDGGDTSDTGPVFPDDAVFFEYLE